MTLRIISPPAVEPITKAELRDWARIDAGNTTDALLDMLIAGARKVAEDRTGRAFITQTWERVYDKFPAAEMEIGMLPLASITSVKYYDADGALQTLASTLYTLDANALPGWVLLAYDETWPDTYAIANAVVIRFVAGYGAAGSDVPAEIRMWICAQVAAAYRNPAGLLEGTAQPLQFLDGLLDHYRIRFF